MWISAISAQLFGDGEWDLFIGKLIGSAQQTSTSRLPPWAAPGRAAAFAAFASALPGVVAKFDLGNTSTWERWAASERCEAEFPPTVRLLLLLLWWWWWWWERWASSERCEAEFPPTARLLLLSSSSPPHSARVLQVPTTVSLFQRILLVNALRPDRLQSACIHFVTKTLGIASLSPTSSSLTQVRVTVT